MTTCATMLGTSQCDQRTHRCLRLLLCQLDGACRLTPHPLQVQAAQAEREAQHCAIEECCLCTQDAHPDHCMHLM